MDSRSGAIDFVERDSERGKENAGFPSDGDWAKARNADRQEKTPRRKSIIPESRLGVVVVGLTEGETGKGVERVRLKVAEPTTGKRGSGKSIT